jgi:hypothetical protein
MKSLLPWLFLVSVSAFAADAPQVVWPKSAVTVVYAPDRPEAAQSVKSLDSGTEFVARGGVIGIRLGPESAIATVVTIGENGKRRVQCARLPEAAPSKEAGNDK